ncbi:MAG: hypothetical protein LBD96_02560 [Treponema sp.]|jgi:hypothetical protein|nr:hypothetical protein [Treponema sp.]
MKKRIFGLSRIAAAVQVLGISLLLLISCNNILGPFPEGQAAGDGTTGTVLLSIGNGIEGTRTLLPQSAEFQRYDLTIDSVPSGGASTNQTINSGASTIALAPGNWTIHVDAYIDAGGTQKAAEGESETFTVAADQTTALTITLAPITGPGAGALSVDISGEDGSIINKGYLRIYEGPDFNDPVEFFDGSSDVSSAGISSTGLDLDISLPAGQYRVAVAIYNSEGQGTFINEISYIYENLATELVQVIWADNFADLTTISGTVRFKLNGTDQSWYQVAVYTNAEGTGFHLSSSYISAPGSQPCTLKVPRPDKNVTLYFSISGGFGRAAAGSLDLGPGDVLVTKDIDLNHETFTLGGTIGTVSLNNKAPDNVGIYAYPPEGTVQQYGGIISGNTWTIDNIPLDVTGTIAIEIEMHDYSNGISLRKIVKTWTPGSSRTGISLGNVSIAFMPIGGTVIGADGLAVANGGLAVFSQPISSPADLETQTPLGDASITGGSFSGTVSGAASGYVTVAVYSGSGYAAYITKTAIALGLSMSLDLRVTSTWEFLGVF